LFADEVGFCMALALYLWEHRNFVWLFEYVTPGWAYSVCLICAGGVYCFNWRVGYVFFHRLYIPCNSQDDFHHRPPSDITRSFFWWHWFVKWSPAHLTHLSLRWQKFLVCPYFWQFGHWRISLLCVWAVQILFCTVVCILIEHGLNVSYIDWKFSGLALCCWSSLPSSSRTV
jgi:hypothetical protein